jgi:hypothetical protein
MKPYTFRLLGFVLGGVSLLAVAAAHEAVSGFYKRNSLTCGGPGIADSATPLPCDLVYEDEMQIGQPGDTPQRSGVVAVSFRFHYGLSDYCRFDGTGEWQGAQLVLRRSNEPNPSDCRLSVSFSETMATVSDPSTH